MVLLFNSTVQKLWQVPLGYIKFFLVGNLVLDILQSLEILDEVLEALL